MSQKNKTVLLFDLDGTLVDSVPDLAVAINQMLTELNLATYTQDNVRSWVGNGAKVLVERALRCALSNNLPLDEAMVNNALTLFLTYYQRCLCVESSLYDGVKETLLALKAQNFRLAIITNKPEQFIEPIIAGFALEGLFELQLGGDSLVQRKPHPLPLIHACEILNTPVEQCLMIGDSKNDILAAKAANMQSIGVTYGYNNGEDIGVYQPDWRVEKFTDILPLLS
jgi:phosphoglycolate phosphatase